MDKTEKVKVTGISMYESEWDIVDHVAEKLGMTRSHAMRFIVTSYAANNPTDLLSELGIRNGTAVPAR